MVGTGLLKQLDILRQHPVWKGASVAAGEFWSTVFPTECVVCSAPDISLCAHCLASVRRATVRPFHAESGAESLPEKWPEVRPADWSYPETGVHPLPVIAAGHYRKDLALTVLAYKNHGHTDLVRPLQAALAGALHRALEEAGGPDRPVILVPVPTKQRSVRRRGYDPLGLLLAGLRKRGELPAGCTVTQAVRHRGPAGPGGWLRSVVSGSAQKGLGRGERRSNVAHTMQLDVRWRGQLSGHLCVVVDDVLTTGSTIAEVARVLRLEGAQVAAAVVVAATPAPAGTEDKAPVPAPGAQRTAEHPVGNGTKKEHRKG